MPRYFFNVRARSETILDPEGSALPSLEAARAEAILDARAAMSRAILTGLDISRRYTIDICDEEGRVLLSVPFTDAILADEDE